MLPTLEVGQVIKVRPIRPDDLVGRGDIVFFKRPAGPSFGDLVKRVVGLPGDTISAHGGRIYVDGKQLSEPYLPARTMTTSFPPVTLSPDHYWLMRDNRGNTIDSRVFGPIGRAQITGLVETKAN